MYQFSHHYLLDNIVETRCYVSIFTGSFLFSFNCIVNTTRKTTAHFDHVSLLQLLKRTGYGSAYRSVHTLPPQSVHYQQLKKTHTVEMFCCLSCCIFVTNKIELKLSTLYWNMVISPLSYTQYCNAMFYQFKTYAIFCIVAYELCD